MENKNYKFGSKAWFAANWKNILLVLLVCFSVNKCTQSCNRSTTISKLKNQVSKLDSTVQFKDSQVIALTRDTTDYINQIRMYKGFNKQRNVSDSINAVNNAKQKAQTDELIRQIKRRK